MDEYFYLSTFIWLHFLDVFMCVWVKENVHLILFQLRFILIWKRDNVSVSLSE